ncbi:hypothetical protein Pmani_022418 [Petrolisthes manimaculis]|uniref:Uncharacterized protein n=1 Tax=Petrolisthes manimaculis TaxID=1843537 RepID=A0AAE1PEI0_9EUCA|nr:hypothetical protein Pmani_022418 [Petrolisthes manimaculis]
MFPDTAVQVPASPPIHSLLHRHTHRYPFSTHTHDAPSFLAYVTYSPSHTPYPINWTTHAFTHKYLNLSRSPSLYYTITQQPHHHSTTTPSFNYTITQQPHHHSTTPSLNHTLIQPHHHSTTSPPKPTQPKPSNPTPPRSAVRPESK